MSTAPSHEVLQQAAAWYARMSSGRITEVDRAKLQQWLELRSDHRQAWSLVERIGGRFGHFHDDAEKHGALKSLQASGAPLLSRRRALLGLGGLSVAGWLGWRTLDAAAPGYLGGRLGSYWADYSTGVGESQQWQLRSGSALWLNTRSAANRGAAGEPRIELLAGELQVDERGAEGPGLIVSSAQAQISSRNALFNVRLGEGSTCIDVYAGALEVTCAGRRQQVLADQQLNVTSKGFAGLRPASAAHRSWVQGVLVAEGLTLGEVLAELGRYRYGYLGCDPRVAALPVVGTFSIRDTDRALASLAKVLPVKVKRLMPWWVTLEAQV